MVLKQLNSTLNLTIFYQFGTTSLCIVSLALTTLHGKIVSKVFHEKIYHIYNFICINHIYDLGIMHMQREWTIAVATPSFAERVTFVRSRSLILNGDYSSFSSAFTMSKFCFESHSVQKIFELLENPTIVSMIESYTKKVEI